MSKEPDESGGKSTFTIQRLKKQPDGSYKPEGPPLTGIGPVEFGVRYPTKSSGGGSLKLKLETVEFEVKKSVSSEDMDVLMRKIKMESRSMTERDWLEMRKIHLAQEAEFSEVAPSALPAHSEQEVNDERADADSDVGTDDEGEEQGLEAV